MKKSCVVFGGNGFVGEYVTQELSKKGVFVVAPTREDLQNLDQIKNLIHEARSVVWLLPPVPGLLESLDSVLAEAPRFLYASTLLLYGAGTEKQSEKSSVFPETEYEKNKLNEELLLKEIFKKHPDRLCIMRLANVYGDVKNRGIVGKLFEAAIKNSTITLSGDGTQRRDFIHVEDVASCIALLEEKEPAASGVFNICSGTSYSMLDVVNMISEIIGRAINTRSEPGAAGKNIVVGDNTKLLAFLNLQMQHNFKTGLQKTLSKYD